MERFSLTDLQSFELKFNSMSEPVRVERPRIGRTTYQRHPKPPYTYTGLIVTAIQSSEPKKLTLADIHITLGQMFPFFRDARYNGWKDSVRHNLSHHDCFQMELKDPTRKNGKGNFWKVDMTKVNLDMFKRQQTNVAREGNWAEDLHQQLGIPSLECREGPLILSLPLSQGLPQSPPLSRKRKFVEDTSINYVKPEEPALKRHQPFTIANILREHQPVTTAAQDVKPFNNWTIPQASSWHQLSTPQSPDDSGCYGSSSSATTSPGETLSHETSSKTAEPAHSYSQALDLCLRDFQCPSFDGLPAFESLNSPGTNHPDTTVAPVYSPKTCTTELPACSMTSRSQVPSNFWATASLPQEVPTDYDEQTSFADAYKSADYWTDFSYFIYPGRLDNYDFCSS